MNKFNVLSFFIALLLSGNSAIAQYGKRDQIWVQGAYAVFSTDFSSSPPANRFLDSNNKYLYFSLGSSNICDTLGNLLIACNGYDIFDKNLDLLDNGDTIVPKKLYEFQDGFSSYIQSSIILPLGNNKFKVVTPTASDSMVNDNWIQTGSGAVFDLLLYSEVDMAVNGGAGSVVKKMVPLLQNARLSKTQMMACRHGDGKSWWLLKTASDSNLVYKFLFTVDSVYGPYIQSFPGMNFGPLDIMGQAAFSADGTKYAAAVQGFAAIFLADFDRCSGRLSNPRVINVPPQLTGNPTNVTDKDSSSNGLSFSPDGRFLYVAGFFNIQQLDLDDNNMTSAWTRLSGPDTSWAGFQYYSSIYQGPDGKLYIGNWGGLGGQMSVIDYPNNKGAAAGFCRKCLRFPSFDLNGTQVFGAVSGPPCMPNYHLGPTNPPCALGVPGTQSKQSDFSIYPNPSSGTITIRYDDGGTVVISDALGKQVMSTSLPEYRKSITVQTDGLATGVYYYRYLSGHSVKANGKLTIIK